MTQQDLSLSFAILGPGGWIELEDEENGYSIHKESRAEQATTWRRQQIESAYVEGTFTNMAVRENVTEALAIYVQGETQFEFRTRLQAVLDALSQLQFQVRMTVGNLRETWTCEVSDYTIQTPQEMVFATMGVVRASVPRLPSVLLEEVV